MVISRPDMLAIVAVVDIAIHSQDGPVRGLDIERRHGLSRRYLEKLLQDLVAGRILTGARGKLGGYRLARAPNRIAMYDILRALHTTANGVGGRTRSAIAEDIVLPALHHAQMEFFRSLRRITVQDLAKRHSGSGYMLLNKSLHRLERFWTDQIHYRL
jgi:Rrf2 family protein